MRTVSVYIDTSIKGPRRRDGSCLYILAFQASGGGTADAGGWIRREGATENQLALLGLECALRRLKEPCRLLLHLECRYAAAALRNKWYEEWERNGWRNAKGRPVADADLWRSIQYLLNGSELEVLLQADHPYQGWMRTELSRENKN